ncbi:MAG: hypothetical protein G01um10148_387 [Parcubacteria group bacterium Gr01-1014_8]|nr:MAG: hypothetical protein G01um10148_387 [Parcubacteria group bacterium Gr01-1014_8]
MSEHSPQRAGLISNILAVAGFIILIAIVVWGAFHFLNIASSGFSSLFNRSSTGTIQITLSQRSVASGQPLDLSWKYTIPTGTGSGSFALLYQCRDGFQFRAINAAGVVSALPCGSAQVVGDSNAKNVKLVPVLTGTSPVDVQISVIFQQATTTSTSTQAASVRAQGNATVTITPAAAGTATSTPVVTPTQPAVSQGKPDLVVRIIAVGVIDQYSGMFVNRAPSSDNEVVAVKFDIANLGGPSGAWYFTAELPTSPLTPYTSPQQRSLGKGDHIENTLRFNRVTPGGGTFSVSVDPYNSVAETNESNNRASQWINGGFGYYPSPYQGSYYPYQY